MEGGDRLGGYRLVEPLGSGGMGTVWVCEEIATGRRAAIKVLRAELATRSDLVGRFLNEARAATAVSDPGIVQVFDAGMHDGVPYIVMELLVGEGLDERLERGALSVLEALRIAHQVAHTIGAAHAARIVHRDLKPANIFLARDAATGIERPKVLDFGIAKLGELSAVKTSTSAVMGTPLYMSPEQCRGGGDIDARSDVYSLGCVLFALVTGRPPFEGLGGGEIIGKHQFQEPPAPSSLISVPPTFDALVGKCLAKDPAARFANARELASAIEAMLARPSFGDWVQSLPPDLQAMAAQMRDPVTVAREGDPRNVGAPAPTTLGGAAMALPPARSTKVWIAGVAAAIAIGAGLGFVASRGGGGDARPAAAPPDAQAATVSRIGDALAAFGTWSTGHAGAPCPTSGELKAPRDGWSRELRVTCTDQPADHRIGVVSAGPDGAFGTTDDITSWSLPDLAPRIRGPRWR